MALPEGENLTLTVAIVNSHVNLLYHVYFVEIIASKSSGVRSFAVLKREDMFYSIIKVFLWFEIERYRGFSYFLCHQRGGEKRVRVEENIFPSKC